ncbi:uncharacterized protein [Watersipora subatra]|uniref:uncharacterized protein isoform X2 n=1 Tax=Watersipora subatra TaxID=2589382 RepID=UPI00355C211A
MAARDTKLYQLLLMYSKSVGGADKMREALINASAETRYSTLKEARNPSNDFTAVHRAAIENDKESLKYMLAGLPTDQKYEILQIKDIVGGTALDWAAWKNHWDTLVLILSGLSTDQRFEILKKQEPDGFTLLHHAARCNHSEELSILLAAVTPEQRDQLLAIKDKNNQTIDKIKKLPELTYGHTLWNSLRQEEANQSMKELEKTVNQLSIDNSRNSKGLADANQRIKELEDRVHQLTLSNINHAEEVQRLTKVNTTALVTVRKMEQFNRRCFSTSDTGDQEHEF